MCRNFLTLARKFDAVHRKTVRNNSSNPTTRRHRPSLPRKPFALLYPFPTLPISCSVPVLLNIGIGGSRLAILSVPNKRPGVVLWWKCSLNREVEDAIQACCLHALSWNRSVLYRCCCCQAVQEGSATAVTRGYHVSDMVSRVETELSPIGIPPACSASIPTRSLLRLSLYHGRHCLSS